MRCISTTTPPGWAARASTWKTSTSARERGGGAGKALLKYIARQAVAEGCGRFEWSVLDWNTPAIEFYTAAGAKPQDEWTVYRLQGQALHDFANG